MINLRQKYEKEVILGLKKKLGYPSIMAVPKIIKVVINTGFGRRVKEEQERIGEILTKICGQKVSNRPSRKAIASFKSRKGQIVGAAATLRGERMFAFLTKLFFIALPRARDFRGIDERSVDGNGNLTIGIKEHIVFPEASGEDTKPIFGFEATIVTDTRSREEALELFKALGVPFKGIGPRKREEFEARADAKPLPSPNFTLQSKPS